MRKMRQNKSKKIVSFLMALIMTFSLVPVQAFATETGEEPHNHTEVSECVHEYAAGEVVAPTPEAKGYTPYTCQLCGDSYQSDFVDYVAPEGESAAVVEWTDEMLEIQELIDEYIEYYLLYDNRMVLPEGELTEEEWESVYAQIEDIVVNVMDDNERENATIAVTGVCDYLSALITDGMITDEQFVTLWNDNPVFDAFEAVIAEYGCGGLQSLAADAKGLDVANITATYGSASDGGTLKWTVTANSVTADLLGAHSTGGFGGKEDKYADSNAMLTLTNTSPTNKPVCIMFSCTSSIRNRKGSVTITYPDGSTASGGNVEKVLTVGQSVRITIAATSNSGYLASYATNGGSFTLTNIVTTGTVKFAQPEVGSYSVDGNNIAAETPITKNCGETFILKTSAVDGYEFLGWFADDVLVDTSMEYSFVNPGNCSVKPKFVEKQTVSVSFGAIENGGTYQVDGAAPPAQAVEAESGKTFRLSATTANGYTFAGWFADDATTPLAPTETVTLSVGGNITSDCTIYPKFQKLPVEFDSTLGTVIGNGAWETGKSIVIKATPNNGITFMAWTDGNGNILSTDTTYSGAPTEGMTMKVAFVSPNSTAWFKVDDTHLFNDLNAAAAAGTKIVLAADGTLPAGDYTIPSGDTLLIPRDEKGTIYTSEPPKANGDGGLLGGYDLSERYITPRPFRTLTMAAGANITVNGAISVAGAQYAGGTPVGGTHGPYGAINMAEGSKITVNSGANLYCWGYISGSGGVEVLGGGTVYESFQVMDWRGGQATSGLLDNENKVFPMSQYYVQNVEVPMTLWADAVETGYTCVTASGRTVGTAVPFVGENSLFTIDSGYLIKDYNESTDRQTYQVYGDVAMRKISITMPVVGTLDSSQYVLPITNNLTVEVVSGKIDITQDLAFLPGSEIIVGEETTCNLADGKSVYVYDLDEWVGYCGTGNASFIALEYAPGKTGTREPLSDAKVQINGTVNADSGFLYTTTGGASITSKGSGVVRMMAGTAAATYQVTQVDTNTSFAPIPIQVAKLQNGDHTAENPSTTDNTKINPSLGVVYTYTDGVWVADCPGDDTCEFPAEQFVCKAKECIYCDYVDSTNLAEHTPGAAATCTAPQTCTVCGDVLTAALNHSEETIPGTPATCYATGLTEGKKCSRCGVTLTEQTVIEKIAHTWGAPVINPSPTCTTNGTKTYTCTVCAGEGINTTKTEPVDQLGHHLVLVEGQDATCTEDGWEEYYQCAYKYGCECDTCAGRVTFCGAVFEDADGEKPIDNLESWKVIPKKGHETTKTDKDPATCTAPGTEAYWYCSACETYYSDEACNVKIPNLTNWLAGAGKIPAKEHDWSSAVAYTWSEDNTTCTAKQVCTKNTLPSCTRTETVNSTNVVKDPTCTEAGSTTYTADFAQDWAADQTKEVAGAAATDHSYTVDGKSVVWNATSASATCTATLACTACDKVIDNVRATVSETSREAATCTEGGEVIYSATFAVPDGETGEMVNTVEPLTEKVTISALQHNWVEEYVWAEDYSTCTATRTCQNDGCGEEETLTGTITRQGGATCTEGGTITYTANFAENWAEPQTKSEARQPLGHNVSELTAKVSPTCQKTGTAEHYKCSRCSRLFRTMDDAANNVSVTDDALTLATVGHKFTTYVYNNDASCTQHGTKTASCDFDCGESETIPDPENTMLDHVWGEYTYNEGSATCLADGTKTAFCTYDCGTKNTVTAEGTKLEHSYTEEVVTAATCTNKGLKKFTCANSGCNDGYTEEIPKLGHQYALRNGKDPSCYEEGWNDYYQCTRSGCGLCFANENDTNAIVLESWMIGAGKLEKVDHDYNSVVTAPTCLEEGYTTYTCQVCPEETEGHSYVDDYTNPLNHNYDDGVVTTQPTCTEEGIKTFTCLNAGCTAQTTDHSYTVPVAALGHELVKFDGEESTCNEAGHVAYYQCAAESEGNERSYYCGCYFASEEDTTVQATPIATTEDALTVWKQGDGALPLRQCVDADKNHECDYDDCDEVLSSHTDVGKDHKCDIYGENCALGRIGAHEDQDNADMLHKCDYCGEKLRDHEFSDGICDCGYVQDLKVTITIKAQNQNDQNVPVDDIKYKNSGEDFTKTLNLSEMFNASCYTIQSVSAKVGGVDVENEYQGNTLTIASEKLTGNVEIVVNAYQNHQTDAGHTTVTIKDPTCTEPGEKKTVLTCINCSTEYSTATEEIPAKKHDWVVTEVAPTFDADGYTNYHCKNDDRHDYKDVHEGTKLIAVAEFNSTKYQTLEEAVAAAAESRYGGMLVLLTKGVVEGTQVWDLGNRVTVYIPAVEGNYGLIIKGDLTIKSGEFVAEGMFGIGVQATGKLTIDGGTFGVWGNNDYLIGTWGTTVINGGEFVGQYSCVNVFDSYDPNVTSTLTITGGTFETEEYDCTDEYKSSDVFAGENTEVVITGGTFSKSVEDYVAEGHCQVKDRNEYNVAPHEPGTPVEENRVEADCVNPGSYELVTSCTRCGKETSREHKVIEATGHTVTVIEGKVATCTEPGYKEAYYCSVCDKYFATRSAENEKVLSDEITVELSVWQTTAGEKAAGGMIVALGHELVHNTKVSATCENSGVKEYWQCSRCSAAFEDEAQNTPIADLAAWTAEGGNGYLSATNHSYTDAVTTDPTCTEDGVRTFTCQNTWCDVPGGDTKTEPVPKLNHDYVVEYNWNEARTTCTASAVCNNDSNHFATMTATVTVEVTTEAECEKDGAGVRTAAFASNSYGIENQVEAVVIPATNHSYTHYVSDNNATCTEDGTKTAACNNGCGKKDTVADVGSAKGHNMTEFAAVPETCTTAGNIHYYQCGACLGRFHDEAGQQPIAENGHIIPAKNHDYQTAVTPPTCTDRGYTTYTCSRGDSTYQADFVEALNHDYDWEGGKIVTAPTCTEDGYTTYDCSRCDETHTGETVDKTGHNGQKVTGQNATCTEDGWNDYYKCQNACGLYYENAACTTVIGDWDDLQLWKTTDGKKPAWNHNYQTVSAVEPDCDDAGHLACFMCKNLNCGLYFVENEEGEKVLIGEAGSLADYTTWISEGGAGYLEPKGHTGTFVEGQPAKCEADGWKDYYQCEDCKLYFEDEACKEPIGDLAAWKTGEGKLAQIGHAWDEGHETTPPTCTEPGVMTYTCGNCNDPRTEEIPAKGHTINEIEKVDPKCNAFGTKEYFSCDECDLYYATRTGEKELADKIGDAAALIAWKNTLGQGKIAMLPHTEVVDPYQGPSCTEKGKTEGKHCEVCGHVIKAQDDIPMKPHTETIDAAKAPTCTETGLTEGKHCSVCNAELVKQEEVPAKGHSGVLVKGQPAKCEADGWKDYYQCKECKLYFLDENCQEPIADLAAWKTGDGKLAQIGHKWDDGRETTLPTCTEPGVMTFTCENCNGPRTEEIPELGHDPVQHAGQHPTYYSVGWEPYETCNRPGCDYTTMTGIPALGEPSVSTFAEFMTSLQYLEGYANEYAKANPGKDPLWLLIKYVRTGVDRYNSGSWNIMAGYEDEGFAKYVMDQEEAFNKAVPNIEDMINVTGIKNIKNFELLNGDSVDFGHMFGTMDITYHNKTSINHADVAGWAGDLVDLLSTADRHDVTGTVDEMIKIIGEQYLNHSIAGESDQFSQTDMYGDLDGYYFMNELIGADYEAGMLYNMMKSYFSDSLTNEQRADYFLKNRLGGVTSRSDIREAVFREYTGNGVIATLEGTREFKQTDVSDMRKACCYAFADYLCKLAGDYVELGENPYFSVFSSETSTLAPGITQQINKATMSDGKQVVYYTAIGDVTSPFVNVYANYKDNDPSLGWGMQRVRDQANAAQAKYGDPASNKYIPNYNVIAAINGSGYNMTTGEPSGVLMMGGVEYHAPNGNGFFGIRKDGTACMGSEAEYYDLKAKGELSEAIEIFGTLLVKDGKINVSTNDYSRASRTAIGYTKTGKVVFMVMDGRQEPVSCGGSMAEIAQVMLEAGCVWAVNLDGGGSTTYVARVPGDDALSVVSSPSDGFERSVATSWIMVSTAPSSTAFDKAILNSEVRHMTVGASTQVTAAGVSATGNSVELPEGTTWAVSDSSIASISSDGVVTGLANGTFDVRLMLGDQIIGSRTMYVVVPDAAYFTKENMNAVYGESTQLPVAALFEGKPVAVVESDFYFTLSNETAGTTEGIHFIGNEESGIKTVKISAHVVNNSDAVSGTMGINMFRADEASFDFENADGGDRLLAWNRVVSNATTADGNVYTVVDVELPMVTEYTFGMDMTQIPIPEQLNDLIYMLPGADVEGNNSAWDFLLQLAERVSVRTHVKATLKLDPNFDVDHSGLSVNCEYFNLEEKKFDPETNELTLTLYWKDQTKAIDPDTANPLVILAGIKLTPKEDAAWGAKDRLTVVNTGDISYDIYLRANALYSFASKPENQAAFGLLPFYHEDIIINGAPESGGHFADTYKTFSDEYTLNKGMKNGWVYEDGGYAYYEDDVKYTGIRKVGQYYYDFGENGINIGQTKYTGMFQIGDINHYAKAGVLTGGWFIDGDDKYYFDETGKAVDGEVILDEVKMVFNNGLLIGGQTGFVEKTNGNTYYYQNGNMYFGWLELGNDWYHFNTENGIMTVGDGTANSKLFPDQEAKAKGAYYVFDAEGHALYGFPNNFGYYYWAGQPMRDQWVRNGYDLDAWYHTNGNGHYVTTPNASETTELELDGVTYTAVVIAYDGVEYTFDNTNGKLLLGSKVLKAGQWYYYWAGEPVNDGWFDFAGDTYYAYADGHLATGSHVIDGETYMFTPQGALIKEGPALKVTMNSDFTQMTVVTSQFKDVAAVKMAVWSEAGNQQDMKWFDASVDGDGVWSVTIPMCQNYKHTGEYLIHAYEFKADGVPVKVLVNTTFKVDKIGHVANEPVKQNVDAKTCVKDGSYDLVTTCKLCNETIDSVHKTEPATGHTDADTNDMCDVCGEYLGETIETIAMHRLYNPNTGEHFYTGSEVERDTLVEAGWQYEGVAWNAPATAGAPIFRLYNPNSGDHHYTGSEEERDMLVDLGWQYEGVAWNTLAQTEHPQYRLYNPNADIGSHHYTGSAEERDFLVSLGWHYEGIGWYGC